MFGIGTAEIGVILIIVVLLFAPTLVAFWIGFTLGQRKSGRAEEGDRDRGTSQTDRSGSDDE